MMLTGLVRRRLAVAADALLGSEVFTKLPATKTVLCVVATSGPPAALGLAVTDPYLGHARALPPLAWKGEDAIRQIAEVAAEHDAGALAFALPLAETVTTDAVGERDALIRLVSHYDSGAMEYWSEARGAPFRAPKSLIAGRHGRQAAHSGPALPPLRCLIDERLDSKAVEAAKAEEPEVWADTAGEGPSNDAAAHLSSFLYAYSGGWRNTFG
ncbi:unnamed protein product [Pelagomonas calceolata]|uniref:Uncharacterized protein n=2 Tax=Pelagomonas calceolata TaxID=35677 RepID=A0A8J2SI00_9STRA|nr:unnamed protein product [Pelagomonas calceolata]